MFKSRPPSAELERRLWGPEGVCSGVCSGPLTEPPADINPVITFVNSAAAQCAAQITFRGLIQSHDVI